MKKVFFIFIMIHSFSSCAQETKQHQLISQEEFAQILTKEIQLLDVRTPQEYQQGYIEGGGGTLNIKSARFWDVKL